MATGLAIKTTFFNLGFSVNKWPKGPVCNFCILWDSFGRSRDIGFGEYMMVV